MRDHILVTAPATAAGYLRATEELQRQRLQYKEFQIRKKKLQHVTCLMAGQRKHMLVLLGNKISTDCV